MNFKTIKRAEELRLNIEKTDKEIIQLEKIMQDLVLQDRQGITLNLNLDKSINTKPSEKANRMRGLNDDGESIAIINIPRGIEMQGFFKLAQEEMESMRGWMPEGKRPSTIVSKNNFTLTNAMALQFLTIYHASILDERALLFKLLQECIKTLQVID